MLKNYQPLSLFLQEYLVSVSLRESKILMELRERTSHHEFSEMATPPEQTQFLAFLIRLMRAKRVIEVGVFTGYSTLAMAEALPENGELIACDKQGEWVAIGEPFWERAGVRHKISVCIDDACITLQNLLDEGAANSFDFMYIDADKIHYQDYWRLGKQLVRSGGLMAFDNVLKLGTEDGDVPARKRPATRALDDFNKAVKQDETFFLSMLPIGYGLTLLLKT